MPLAWLKRFIGAAVLCGVPGTAHAGAWVVAKEQTILKAAAGETDAGEIYEASLYGERPFGEHFALVENSYIESAPNYYDVRSARTESVTAIKRSLDDEGRIVSAMQGGVVWRQDPLDFSCGQWGGELRYLTGMSLGTSVFVNGEAAVRGYGGGCSEERVDLTAGYRPGPNWLALGEMFAQFPDGGAANVKLQISAVRYVGEDWGVQLGLRGSVAGYEGPLMLILGVWH